MKFKYEGRFGIHNLLTVWLPGAALSVGLAYLLLSLIYRCLGNELYDDAFVVGFWIVSLSIVSAFYIRCFLAMFKPGKLLKQKIAVILFVVMTTLGRVKK